MRTASCGVALAASLALLFAAPPAAAATTRRAVVRGQYVVVGAGDAEHRPVDGQRRPGSSAPAAPTTPRPNPSGAGSVDGMAAAPVATAASGNPLLTTLVAAVSGKLNPKVDLVSTLNGGEFTVFAPVDSAFAKIPAATINTLKTDDALLTKILTYHVVPGQLDAGRRSSASRRPSRSRHGHGHRLGRQPEGQRRQRHLRRREDRQRHRLPDRLRPDAAGCLTTQPTTAARRPLQPDHHC